jgi:hypothetical protein
VTPLPHQPVPLRRRAPAAALAILAAGGLAGAGLAACGSSQTTSSSPASTTSTRSGPATSGSAAAGACSARQLVLAYSGTEGATGHLEVALSLRNGSGRACTLRGYPVARLLDAAGHTLPMRIRRGGGFFPDTRRGPQIVVLRPGRRARYGLSFATNNEYAGARRCFTVAALVARPPGTGHWTRVTLAGGGRPRIAPCGTAFVLSPVYAG